MRRALVVLLAVALLPTGAAAAPSRRPKPTMTCGRPAGRVVTCTVNTSLHVRGKGVRVVLPASYGKHGGRARYPVVYVLHGVGDDETSWTNPARGDLAALTAHCEAIFVTPDGGSGREAGWYSDWYEGPYEWERYHVGDLPSAVDRTFRTKGSDHRAIAGMSMGGFGAMSYAARNPGRYRAAASYSGFLDTMFAAPGSGAAYDVSGQNDTYSTGAPSRDVWGDQTLEEGNWRAHNPYDRAAGLRGTALYVAGGTGVAAPAGPDKAPLNAVEAYTRTLTDRFVAKLRAEGIAFADGRYDGGTHDWPEWRAAFRGSLRVLMPALEAPPC